MEYFFPGILTTTSIAKHSPGNIPYNFDSASSALRFVLKYIGLNKGDKVAIPAFVCDSVEAAVIAEKLEPLKMDLKNDSTFWSEYDEEKINSNQINAVLLVHLYGFLHPDTEAIMQMCKKKNIPLIHDLAQCYGIDEEKLQGDNFLIYSFGPGKSSVAALGGSVKRINDEPFYNTHTQHISKFSLANLVFNTKAKLFIKSRGYKRSLTFLEKLSDRLFGSLSYHLYNSRTIYSMTKYQQRAASHIMQQIDELKVERRTRYIILKEAIESNSKLKIAYSNDDGNYFKTIVYCDALREEFSEFLHKNQVPFFRLFDETMNSYTKHTNLLNFKKYASGFFEFSTEVSLPLEEVKRVALILRSYK